MDLEDFKSEVETQLFTEHGIQSPNFGDIMDCFNEQMSVEETVKFIADNR